MTITIMMRVIIVIMILVLLMILVLKMTKKYTHNMTLMSRCKGQLLGERSGKDFEQGPPHSGNARNNLFIGGVP